MTTLFRCTPLRAGRLRVPALAALVLALLASTALPAVAATGEERRLQETRARIAAVRAELERAKSQRSNEAAALAAAKRRLAVVMEAVANAEQALQRQEQAVADAERRLQELRARQTHQQQVTANRAVALYKQGALAPVAALLESRSPSDAVQRSAIVHAVTRAETATVETLAASQVAIAAQQKILEEERAALARVAAQQRAILAEADALRRERSMALAAADEKIDTLAAQERHLESESREIAALARRATRTVGTSRSLASAPAPAPAPAPAVAAPAAGGWTWPTRGRVTSGFGRRWGRMHEGIDIAAPTGTPIVAARAGTVSYAGRMSGYGNIVLIQHGGGIVTAYAHQSRILARVGQAVGLGERIGSVGSTGRSTGPHLHFEVRVNGSPRNPRAYLP